MTSGLLRRYTTLESALHILQNKALTLLTPNSWDDTVDRNLMAAYQRRKRLKSVLALCFSRTNETYHHWRVFTDGRSGVCIVFERARLELEAAKSGVITKSITYKRIAEDRAKPATTAGLPFTKRYAFRDEKEVRMLYTSFDEDLKTRLVPIPVAAIEVLILNPWMPDTLVKGIKAVVHRDPDFSVLEVRKSALFDSPYWRRVAEV